MKDFLRIFIIGFLIIYQPLIAYSQSQMKVSSPIFKNNGSIPKEFTCQGQDVNPPLVISDVPLEAKSLALIVDDPDAPMGTWVHWVVFNISPDTKEIPQKSIPGIQGRNDFNQLNYGGPCPPSGTHRYFFKVYALDTSLESKEGIAKNQLLKLMKNHIIDNAELVGLYKKQ